MVRAMEGVVRMEMPRPEEKVVEMWMQKMCSPVKFIIRVQDGSESQG